MDLSRASGWIFTLSRWCHTTGTRREPSSQNTESPLGTRRSKKLKNLCWTPCVSSWWKSSARCQPSSPAWASPGMAPGWTTLFVPKKAKLVDGLCDWFSMEGHTLDRIDLGARVGHADDRPHEVGMLLNSSWYVPTDDQAPPAAMSE